MFLLNNQSKKLFLSKPQKVVRGKIQDSPQSFDGVARRIIVPRFKIKDSREAGVTLLLAILILSSVLAISFSLATIMFIEVRTSGDLLKTEPALYAATGVGEQAMFNLERHVCKDGTSNPCSYTTSFSNNVTMPIQPTTLSVSTPIFTDKVKVGSNSISTTLNKYDFCDVTAGALGCQYGKVVVNYTSGDYPLTAYLCEFDATGATIYPSSPCTQVNTTGNLGVNQGYWNISGDGNFNNDGGTTLNLTTHASVTWNNLSPNLQQQLILVNPGSTDVYVKISTFADTAGAIPKGLPYVGKTAVDINTLNAAVGRKIQVVVPTGNSGASDQNLALNKAASESSNPFGGSPDRAVDGNTSGNWADSSVTHTNNSANEWWQVDLGNSATIDSVIVWNRTDCCSYRLTDYWVFVSNTAFGPSDTPATLSVRANTWSSHQTSYPNFSTTIPVTATGQYVRVQLSGIPPDDGYLSLAEVQVMGH